LPQFLQQPIEYVVIGFVHIALTLERLYDLLGYGDGCLGHATGSHSTTMQSLDAHPVALIAHFTKNAYMVFSSPVFLFLIV
jgi:hypothetical protein